MFGFFDYKTMGEIAKSNAEEYQKAEPFPHVVIDGAAYEPKLRQAMHDFPKKNDQTWWVYDNVFEKKLAFDKVHMLPDSIKRFLVECNSAPFIDFLETLTGITGLVPDMTYAGGGLHQIQRGGKLDVHCDFNWHGRLQLHRRINVIMYLNEDWKLEYMGQLELWPADMSARMKVIAPFFNRMVIFNTTDFSPHGHPVPLECPIEMTRKSFALYYYTASRPEHEIKPAHRTIYKRRPEDAIDPEVERLREIRAHGRIEDKTS
jgi:Rps23 Pro-64 3,4-dihydroxylase Tpa1-like proline 4-hydroxylase